MPSSVPGAHPALPSADPALWHASPGRSHPYLLAALLGSAARGEGSRQQLSLPRCCPKERASASLAPHGQRPALLQLVGRPGGGVSRSVWIAHIYRTTYSVNETLFYELTKK